MLDNTYPSDEFMGKVQTPSRASIKTCRDLSSHNSRCVCAPPLLRVLHGELAVEKLFPGGVLPIINNTILTFNTIYSSVLRAMCRA